MAIVRPNHFDNLHVPSKVMIKDLLTVKPLMDDLTAVKFLTGIGETERKDKNIMLFTKKKC